MRLDRDKAGVFLYRMSNWIVRIIGTAIFLALTWYALRYTQYIVPGTREIPIDVHDSVIKNALVLAGAAAVTAILLFLDKRLDRKKQRIVCRASMAVMVLWILAAGMWWINSSAHTPVGDQAFIYGGASYFLKGWYGFLDTGGYCDIYPYQLGQIALCELLFLVVGRYNYYAIEVICVILAAGSAYAGYGIVSEITENMAAIVGYCLLMLGCLPLVFYTPWVYGDIPSIFFALVAQWCLLRYVKTSRMRYLMVMALALVMAMLVRRHSMILMVAVCIAALVYWVRHRDKKVILAFCLAAVLSYAAFAGIFRMYEIRSGQEHSKGIPGITWVTMGMQETNGTYGWYNDYPKQVYFGADCDKELTSAIARKDLQDRLQMFRNDIPYARNFFRNKILSQWNQPLYQSLYFNAQMPDAEGGPVEGSLAHRIGSDYYMRILAFGDRWQFIVFVGMLLYFLLAVRKDGNILQHVLAVTIIGGFLFSIIFEAKARYIFPYFVMMFPFAACGFYEAARKIIAWKERKDET